MKRRIQTLREKKETKAEKNRDRWKQRETEIDRERQKEAKRD